MLRIAFISPFFPLKGGISCFSGLLAGELQAKGHAVRPLGFKKLYPSFLVRGHSPEVPEHRSAANGGDAVIVLYNPLTWLALLRNLKRERPDVLLVAYWTGLLAPLLFAIRKLSGIPTVVLLHNLSTHERFALEPFLQKLLFASADGYITLSGEVSGALAAAGNAKPVARLFHPVYPPFSGIEQPEKSEARRFLGYDQDAPLLLFFGYVRRYKGLDLLLRAMPAILDAWPDTRLLVAGQFYEPESGYRELIGQLGIAASVDFRPGYAADADAARYFAAADAAVLPYRQASQSGVAQLACGYGLPVIVTSAGGLAAEVEQGRTGWIAGEISSEALAAAVIGFLGDPRRPAMPQSVREYAAGHSWERFAGEAANFIRSVAKP
ncbi:MAG: glycosyltransferase family 4 protein [Chlorobi bacterium]|nr:glycosyltransferase family 4 protein [Chlorobiota bacterium]